MKFMKHLHFAVVTTKNEKNFASYVDVPIEGMNLQGWMKEFSQRYSIIQCVPSKQKAIELSDFWNDCYKKNGTLGTVLD